MTWPSLEVTRPGPGPAATFVWLSYWTYLRFYRLHVYMTLKHALVSNYQLYVHVNFSRLLELLEALMRKYLQNCCWFVGFSSSLGSWLSSPKGPVVVGTMHCKDYKILYASMMLAVSNCFTKTCKTVGTQMLYDVWFGLMMWWFKWCCADCLLSLVLLPNLQQSQFDQQSEKIENIGFWIPPRHKGNYGELIMERQGGRWECSCHGSTCPHPGAVQAPSNIVDCNVTTLSNLLLAKMTKRRIELSVFVLRYFGERQIPIRYTRDICFVPTPEPTRFAVWIQHIEIVCAGVWCATAVVYAVVSRFGCVSGKAKCLKSIARQSVTEK